MSEPTLVLYETADHWAGPLRRVLRPHGVRLSRVGSLAACQRELQSGVSRVAAVEVHSANLSHVLRLLQSVGRSAPLAGLIVLAQRELGELECVFREAGALDCAFSPRDLRHLARLADRWLRRKSFLNHPTAEESGYPPPLAEVLDQWLADPAA